MFGAPMMAISTLHNPFWTNVFLNITKLGDIHFVAGISIIVIVLLYIKRKYFYAHAFILSLILSGGLVYFLKNMFARPRPMYGIIMESGFSFPSGHSVFITTLCLFLMYVIQRYPSSQAFKMISTVLLFIVLGLVLISRIYLGVHYPGDVFFGAVVGVISVLISLQTTYIDAFHTKFMKGFYN